jgi:hypothetical protein
MQLPVISERTRIVRAFPQVDPGYDEVLRLGNVPIPIRGDSKKWVRF